MGLGLFCSHKKYEVLGWKYENIGKQNQRIIARVRCDNCGKIIEKIIDGDKMNAFATVYEEKFRK